MRRRTHFHSADGHRVSNRKRRWLTWVFAVIFGSAPGTARDIPFATPVTAASSNGVLQAVATDVDGDVTLDVVTVSSVDAVVAWHDNTSGDGSAWSSTTIATSADAAVAMADFDGDGDVDALVGSTVSDAFFLRFNTAGDGSAWSGSTITDLASGDPTDIKPADIDGDGDIDVLITLEETDEVIFFENVNGDGTSWTRLTITDTATDAIAVAAGDIDGDGDIDALVASPGDNTVAFHENTAGDGSAWSEVTISSTFGGARDVFAADVDGDGDLDAVAVARVDDEVSWFENTAGDGSLWTERNIATSILAAFGVFAADLDGDGDVDVLSANRQSDSVLWFENTMGEGTGFTQRTVAAIETASAVVAGDVDGDGDVDVFAASYTDDEVTWHANDTIHRDAFFPTEQTLSSTTAYASSVATADIDGDGDIDAFSAAYNGNAFSWHENTAADGSAWTTQTVASGLIGPLSVVAADIDGDGDQDGVAASFYSEVWFRNDDGMGGSWSTLTIADGGDFERRVAAGDLDGDGDQDVVSASLTNNTVTFHENTAADGSTWAPLLITGTATSVRDVKIADIDGDGDQDVLSASFDDNSVDWYE
ncbi:MAG: VCBS repeat-containing protein, partial [Acidobacteriota bacterium]